jgi:hypothetical protein
VKRPSDVVAAKIAQRTAELELLGATTAALKARHPEWPFDQVAAEAKAGTERFLERSRRMFNSTDDGSAVDRRPIIPGGPDISL